MARIAHNLEYLATATGAGLAQMLPAPVADFTAARLGGLAYRLVGKRRRIALENLERAYGDRLTQRQREEIVHRVFQNIGRTLFEFARFRRMKLDGIRRLVTGPGQDVLKRVFDEGKGGIIVTAHFGNWEILGAWVAACGYPMDFLTGTQHNEKVNNLLNDFRKEMQVGIISLAISARQVFKTLKANHFTGLVSDQHSASGGIVLDFMGRPASTPKGPALFSIRSGAPLLPFLLRRERWDKHVLIQGEPIYPPNSGDEEADIRQMTIAYTRFFEATIREYPDQWMWTHRRWKVTRDVPQSAVQSPS
jgi:Kdo2-lipid IVA lauroyltransferase/acyltransferase